MNRIKVLTYGCNPVLKVHLDYLCLSDFMGCIEMVNSINQINNSSDDILIYNVSAGNVMSGILLWLKGNRIIYHIHDPVPHSGWKNPFIYIFQALLLSVSDIVLVFDNSLGVQVRKYYPFGRTKRIESISHGAPVFSYIETHLPKERIVIGLFGRNMRYKRTDIFLNIVAANPHIDFIIVGKGYEKVESHFNLKIYEGYINADLYYSLMLDVDAVVMPYDRISFSGVLSDSLQLQKVILASKTVSDLMPNFKFLDLSKVNTVAKSRIKKNYQYTQNAWKTYYEKLYELLNE